MRQPKCRWAVLTLCLFATAAFLAAAIPARATDDAMVPFVIPTDISPDCTFALAMPAVAANGPRVVARDGHFFLGEARFRAWGVNTCFGASMPTHADTERIARRLSAFGINSVRIHHLDTNDYPGGIWQRGTNELSPQGLECLDYYIDQLAKNGIRVNLNLHVGRQYSRRLGLADGDPENRFDKMVDLFTPQIIDAHRDYARKLLTHVNAYRKVRYADDPAIAFVEINNEDSLFMWGWQDKLRNLPPFYDKLLREKYTTWLKARYGSTAKVAAAWNAGTSPLGQNMLPAVDAPAKQGQNKAAWILEQHEGCKAIVKPLDNRAGGVRIETGRSDATNWHLQFNCAGLRVKSGQYYTLLFRARADKPRTLFYGANQAHAPWSGLGLSGHVKVTQTWQEFRAGFTATADDDNARVGFSFGGEDQSAFELADVRLAPGGQIGLDKDESLESGNVVVLPPQGTPARMTDAAMFLAQVEKDYFDGMYAFIKKDLGCRALVTGTIVFGPASLYTQSGMDYIDGHAYWQHPQFPGRPWDPANWIVEQQSMVDHPEQATLMRLASERLAGKPFTVSEYNHPAPNDSQAQCVPMIASFAAAQDWDGIWLYSYLHRAGDVQRDFFDSFFDMDANPAKWGFVPAGAMIFREAGIAPFEEKAVAQVGTARTGLTELAIAQSNNVPLTGFLGQDRAAAKQARLAWWDYPLKARTYATMRTEPSDRSAAPMSAIPVGDKPGVMVWDHVKGGTARYEARGERGSVEITAGQLPSMTVTRTALDGRPLDQTRRLLITACGRCENTGMQFSADRRTVGRDWGKGPTRIEAAGLDVAVPAKGTWRCRALKGDGSIGMEVPVTDGKVKLSPKYQTMWYLLTRE